MLLLLNDGTRNWAVPAQVIIGALGSQSLPYVLSGLLCRAPVDAQRFVLSESFESDPHENAIYTKNMNLALHQVR